MAECLSLGDPEGLAFDAPIVVDSLALVWIQHLLEERHGVSIDPERSDLRRFTSVRALYGYLSEKFPDDVACS